ncbi:MAG: hypothetical protein KGJ35_01250 [Patescibacteria group bacterium]|nr:hypothetical protein [Patescibacteria group bacterium]
MFRTFIAIIIIVILAVAAGSIMLRANRPSLLPPIPEVPNTPATSTNHACTMQAMQCSDGTWISASGPNCQFVCPAPAATSTR